MPTQQLFEAIWELVFPIFIYSCCANSLTGLATPVPSAKGHPLFFSNQTHFRRLTAINLVVPWPNESTPPIFKYAVVRAAKRGKTLDKIILCWAVLSAKIPCVDGQTCHEENPSCVCDPSTYQTQRPGLSNWSLKILEYILPPWSTEKPTVYLDENP
ncbi:hypothetical protein PGT21_000746 [Puccinia graminis f. sp. tritici]|uniref:Uncharacterized protein n=1 Tax=Puccinia graminis f. sp. tritici TaxID=56615 RepID=A0A5B0N0U8_PUCGR|nr:hypothetical protein PGT21_000746 [Puccinia graminis f. sp. tritici]